jgi:hypothetical protein
MAYDEGVAERLAVTYAAESNVVEKKMFGGIAFMVNGHMSCGVVNESLSLWPPWQHRKAMPLLFDPDFALSLPPLWPAPRPHRHAHRSRRP